jgi:hypothetical protein
VTRKFFGLLLAYPWGSLVRVGISLVSLVLVDTWWLLAETAIKPIIVGYCGLCWGEHLRAEGC